MKQFFSKYGKFLILLAACLCVAGALLGRGLSRKHALRRDARADRQALVQSMQGTWVRTVEEDRNSLLEFVITPNTMEYNFRNGHYPEYDQTLYSYTWKALNETQVQVCYPEGGSVQITVLVTPATKDTPETLTFSPAVTSTDAQETWERSAS